MLPALEARVHLGLALGDAAIVVARLDPDGRSQGLARAVEAAVGVGFVRSARQSGVAKVARRHGRLAAGSVFGALMLSRIHESRRWPRVGVLLRPGPIVHLLVDVQSCAVAVSHDAVVFAGDEALFDQVHERYPFAALIGRRAILARRRVRPGSGVQLAVVAEAQRCRVLVVH